MAKCLVAGCAKHAMKGSLKCYQHSPEAAEARKQLAVKMVQARAAKRAARLSPQQPTDAPVTPSRWWDDGKPFDPDRERADARVQIEDMIAHPENYAHLHKLARGDGNAATPAQVVAYHLLNVESLYCTDQGKAWARSMLWSHTEPAAPAPKPDVTLGRGLLWTEVRQL